MNKYTYCPQCKNIVRPIYDEGMYLCPKHGTDCIIPKKRMPFRDIEKLVSNIRGLHAEAAVYDAGFDAGEFSGPAHTKMETAQITELLTKHGWTLEEYEDKERTLYWSSQEQLRRAKSTERVKHRKSKPLNASTTSMRRLT